jgi:flagellar motor protein MotB
VLKKSGYRDISEIPQKEEWETNQLRLTSHQKLLEEVGFRGTIDTLYSFLEQWNKIILEMKRIFKVADNEPESMLRKLQTLESLQKRVVIPVTQASIFFDSGQVRIRGEFKQILDTHIEEARQAIKTGTYDLIQIEGHTDNVPIRADNPLYQDNWELSSARAHAVAQYFIERGIPAQHLAVVGHSEFKPQIPGDSPEARAQNRRIEIVFLNSSLLNLELGQ